MISRSRIFAALSLGLCLNLTGCEMPLTYVEPTLNFCSRVQQANYPAAANAMIYAGGMRQDVAFQMEIRTDGGSKLEPSRRALGEGYVWISFHGMRYDLKKSGSTQASTYDTAQAVLEVDGKAYHPAPRVWSYQANDRQNQIELQTQPVLTPGRVYEMAFAVKVTKDSKIRLLPGNVIVNGTAAALPPVEFYFCGDPGGFRPPHHAPC